MPTAFLEIVELPDGRIMLRWGDDAGALITLEFSEDAKAFMQGQHIEIAKAMLSLGIELANNLDELEFVNDEPEEPEPHILH